MISFLERNRSVCQKDIFVSGHHRSSLQRRAFRIPKGLQKEIDHLHEQLDSAKRESESLRVRLKERNIRQTTIVSIQDVFYFW